MSVIKTRSLMISPDVISILISEMIFHTCLQEANKSNLGASLGRRHRYRSDLSGMVDTDKPDLAVL